MVCLSTSTRTVLKGPSSFRIVLMVEYEQSNWNLITSLESNFGLGSRIIWSSMQDSNLKTTVKLSAKRSSILVEHLQNHLCL
jgi:hypothetical protein